MGSTLDIFVTFFVKSVLSGKCCIKKKMGNITGVLVCLVSFPSKGNEILKNIKLSTLFFNRTDVTVNYLGRKKIFKAK